MVLGGVCSKKYKLNFFYTPKSACVTTRQLWYACHPEDLIHGRQTSERHQVMVDFPAPEKWYKGILTVRDPFNRAVSMYTNRVCVYDETQEIRDYMDLVQRRQISFLDFCKYLSHAKDLDWSATNIHFYPQVRIPNEYRSVLLKEDFTNGRLKLFRLESPLTDQYLEFYKLHIGNHFDIMEPRILNFMGSVHRENRTVHHEFPDLPRDCSSINMCGWTEFPDYSRFRTAETESIIYQVYQNDYHLLNYTR